MRRGFFLLVITALVLSAITFLLVLYAQGYRLALDGRNIFTKNSLKLTSTGLLAATSTPDGASIFIDNHLTSATDTTIDLSPGEYMVKIVKEGYLPWEKRLKVQEGVVTETQALLLPAAPKLESLTATGVLNPTPDPNGARIAYGVASASASRKNGVFVLDMNTRPVLTLRNSSLQIVDDTSDTLSTGKFTWSPNGRELLVETAKSRSTRSGQATTYRIRTDEFNTIPPDITAIISITLAQWEKELEEKQTANIESLKPQTAAFISKNFRIISWSADNTKILYEASSSAQSTTIPALIDPPLIGANSQPEEREIKPGRLYIYDTKEGKNFFLRETDPALPMPVWFPDNRHLVFVEAKQIKMVEYDGTNKTVVYSGPFEGNFVYPWPDGSRLLILTSLNPQGGLTPNLYTIDLK